MHLLGRREVPLIKGAAESVLIGAVLTGLVAVVVVVLLLVAGIALTVRRRGGDEVHSVEGYRSTLDTLETVQKRSSAVRVLPRAGAAPAAPGDDGAAHDAAGTAAAVAGTGSDGAGGGRPPQTFSDVAPPLESSKFLRDTPRQRRRAMSSMNHGPRRLFAPIAAVVIVLGALAALAVVGAHTNRPKRNAGASSGSHATDTTVAQHRATTTRTTVAHHQSATTTTTTPTSYTAQTSATGAVTYVPPAPSYVLAVSTTSGACWVQVTDQPSGTVSFSQTMEPGSSQTLHINGTVTVDLGAPGAASLTLDGVPVVLPTTYNVPLSLTFAPPAAGA